MCRARISPDMPGALKIGDVSVARPHEARAGAQLTLTVHRPIDGTQHEPRFRCVFDRCSGHVGREATAERYHLAVIAIGIDPGTAICGFGVVALEHGRLRLVDAGCVRTLPERTDAERLRELHLALTSLVAEHRPERVGVERLFFQRNVMTAMTVGQARGVALLVAAEHGLAVDEPTPNEVKLSVCGNGAADKRQVAAMVSRLLGISVAGVPDDASDALAVAIGCLYRAAGAPRPAVASR